MIAEFGTLDGFDDVLGVIALDLRVPGRVEVQLSNEAASARLEALTRKTKGKV